MNIWRPNLVVSGPFESAEVVVCPLCKGDGTVQTCTFSEGTGSHGRDEHIYGRGECKVCKGRRVVVKSITYKPLEKEDE